MSAASDPTGDGLQRVAGSVVHLTLPFGRGTQLVGSVRAAGRSLTGDIRVVVVRGAWSADTVEPSQDTQSARDAQLIEGALLIESAQSAGDSIHSQYNASSADERLEDDPGPFDWLTRPDVISVAALQGPVSGAGFALALGCDLRLATPDVHFHGPDLRQDALPADGIAAALVSALGYSRAFALCVLGTPLGVKEAAAAGLVSTVVAPGQMDAAVDDLVRQLLSLPRSATTETKALLRAAGPEPQSPALERAARRRLERESAGYAEG